MNIKVWRQKNFEKLLKSEIVASLGKECERLSRQVEQQGREIAEHVFCFHDMK